LGTSAGLGNSVSFPHRPRQRDGEPAAGDTGRASDLFRSLTPSPDGQRSGFRVHPRRPGSHPMLRKNNTVESLQVVNYHHAVDV
jgi:hypothetical protein